MEAQSRNGVSIMAISEADKAKLLTDLKTGAVNVIALHPIKKGEKEGFDEVMGKLREGISWLGLVTGKGNALFYEWPPSQAGRPRDMKTWPSSCRKARVIASSI